MSKVDEVKTLAIYECDECGKRAVAGSKELLTEWTKGGTTEGKDARGVWRPATQWSRCGSCS